jgi:hypothetical protein
MSGDNLYLLSALPTLGELGSQPPISVTALLEHVVESGGNSVLLEALCLSDDLLQRQALISGEIKEAEPTVLTSAQIRDEESLPEYLVPSEVDDTAHLASDMIWESYFRYVSSIASAYNSKFISRWVSYEVGLRNALAIARAKALNLDPQEYLVADDIGLEYGDFSAFVNEWTAAPDPIAGLKVLDFARWQWLTDNDAWFTFNDDELIAYGAKLMLIQRWYRLGREQN